MKLLCLANSTKMSGRCLAGVRLDGGGWVRPVTDHPHGTLWNDDYRYADGVIVALGDVIDVGLIEHRPLPSQPENWLAAFPVERAEPLSHDDLVQLLNDSLHRGEPLFGNTSDRVAQDRFQEAPAEYSLALIEAEDVRFWVKRNYRGNRQVRASFTFGGLEQQDISVTDPEWNRAHAHLDFGHYSLADLGFAGSNRTLFAVSLADRFDDACYKVIAGILVMSR